jgi:hypothetical protein
MPSSNSKQPIIDIFIRKTKNAKYITKYGISFECVELIRRFFATIKGYTFPDVIDAVDFFNKVNELQSVQTEKNQIQLQTYSYPYMNSSSQYLKPGSILFWKYKKNTFPYGHVAVILDSNDKETVFIQQNLNPPVKIISTKELFTKMNSPKSKFLGIKTIPTEISKNIQNVVYSVVYL